MSNPYYVFIPKYKYYIPVYCSPVYQLTQLCHPDPMSTPIISPYSSISLP